MAEKDGGPAFPTGDSDFGMSLRDYFAGQALVGLCGNPDYVSRVRADVKDDAIRGHGLVATNAYQIADAMLVERVK